MNYQSKLAGLTFVLGCLPAVVHAGDSDLVDRVKKLEQQEATTYHAIRFKIEDAKREMAEQIAVLENEIVEAKKADAKTTKEAWKAVTESFQEKFDALQEAVTDGNAALVKEWAEESATIETRLNALREKIDTEDIANSKIERAIFQRAQYVRANLDYLWNVSAAVSEDIASELKTNHAGARNRVQAYYQARLSGMSEKILTQSVMIKTQSSSKEKTKENAKLEKAKERHDELRTKLDELKKSSGEEWNKIREELADSFGPFEYK